jgi:competence protein ComEC
MNEMLGGGLERHPDLAAIYRAMMLGRKRGMGRTQELLFVRTGTMHLFAINGLHIGVVALSVHALLAALRCPRPLAGLAALAVLWIDVDTTGASPSAVRAFLMIAGVEAAYVLARPANPLAAIAASALATLLVVPLDLFSASFQMSYAVVTAIFTLGLPMAARLQSRFQAYRDLPEISLRRHQRLLAAALRHFLGTLGVGLSASLVSAVTGIQFFGVLVPASIPVNLALGPAALLVIVAGFASLILGLAGAGAAGRLFNRAAGVLLTGIQGIVNFAARVPGSWLPAHTRAAWVGPSALAALIGVCLAGYALGWRKQCGGFWPPFALVAATLVFGVKYG